MAKKKEKYKRQQRTVGAFVKIQLDREYHTYGRILNNACFAFYDIKTKEDISDLGLIASKPILFILAMYNHAVTKGRWLKIGKIPLEEKLKILPLAFIQDALDSSKFRIYDPNNDKETAAAREECEGLERAAVWEPEHVESRIRDHFAGLPNLLVERLKIRD